MIASALLRVTARRGVLASSLPLRRALPQPILKATFALPQAPVLLQAQRSFQLSALRLDDAAVAPAAKAKKVPAAKKATGAKKTAATKKAAAPKKPKKVAAPKVKKPKAVKKPKEKKLKSWELMGPDGKLGELCFVGRCVATC